MPLLEVTKKFAAAVQLINGIPPKKLVLLLKRILGKSGESKGKVFNDSEEEQLANMFQISRENLSVVLDGCGLLFEQLAFHVVKPATVQGELEQLGMDSTCASAFAGVWGSEGAVFLDRLRNKSIAPKQLTDVHWRMQVNVAQSSLRRLTTPTSILEFDVSSDAATTDGNTVEKLQVEFTRDELREFYNKLEKIQKQLDSLKA